MSNNFKPSYFFLPFIVSLDHQNDQKLQKLFTYYSTRDRKTRILPGRMELKKFKRFLNRVQRDPRQNEVIFPEECNQSVKKIIDKFNGNRKLSMNFLIF